MAESLGLVSNWDFYSEGGRQAGCFQVFTFCDWQKCFVFAVFSCNIWWEHLSKYEVVVFAVRLVEHLSHGQPQAEAEWGGHLAILEEKSDISQTSGSVQVMSSQDRLSHKVSGFISEP